MSFTNFPNGLTSFGVPVLPFLYGIPVTNQSHIYFVDPARGNDGSAGTFDSPLATVTEAEDRCIANQHDIVFVIGAHQTGSSTSTYLTEQLVWDKDHTHLIGLCPPVAVSQRARIAQYSTTTGLSPMVDWQADGCVVANIQFFQGVDDATSLINVQVTGQRNVFQNVHFAGGGHATQAVDGGASLKVNGGDENRFIGCTIGVDSIAAATGMVAVLFDGEATRNSFERCLLTLYAGDTAAAFVEVVDNTGIDRYTRFTECEFINSNKDNFTIASAFVIPAWEANNSSCILLKDCMSHGVTKNDANDRAVLYGNMNAYTAADLGGVAVLLNV